MKELPSHHRVKVVNRAALVVAVAAVELAAVAAVSRNEYID